jgi:hypothetical protein
MVVDRPEIELLLSCARTRKDSESVSQITSRLQGDMDWAYLLRTARRHGMMPLVYWHLSKTCPEAVPQDMFDHLRNHLHRNAHRNLCLTAEIAQNPGLVRGARYTRHLLQRTTPSPFGTREPLAPRIRRFGHPGAQARRPKSPITLQLCRISTGIPTGSRATKQPFLFIDMSTPSATMLTTVRWSFTGKVWRGTFLSRLGVNICGADPSGFPLAVAPSRPSRRRFCSSSFAWTAPNTLGNG